MIFPHSAKLFTLKYSLQTILEATFFRWDAQSAGRCQSIWPEEYASTIQYIQV